MALNRNKRMVKQMAMKGENKKCFECALKSTPYVIMDFGVFVCTKCSGIHRNFQHKVKGISMTNFKDEDVKRLKELGGNEEARKKWRIKHDPKKYPFPKPNDEYGIRKFVDQTFVAKRWYNASYYKKKINSTPDSKNIPKPKPKPKPIPKVGKTPVKRNTPSKQGGKKKPFRKATPPKSRGKSGANRKADDPFGDGDPFDKADPFGDDNEDWFDDFPEDKDFEKKQKTPNVQPKNNDGGGGLLMMEDPKETTSVPPAKTEEKMEEGWFDINEQKNEKKFPDLDKLFGSPPKQAHPTGPIVGRGYPAHHQPPVTGYPVEQPPYGSPPYGQGGPVQYPPYGRGGPVQQQVQQGYHPAHQPYQQQQPRQPGPYGSPPMGTTTTNPFLVGHQQTNTNPFLMGNTPPRTAPPTNPGLMMMGRGQQPNTSTAAPGGFDIFGPSKTEPKREPLKKEVEKKPSGPDPFEGLLGMGF